MVQREKTAEHPGSPFAFAHHTTFISIDRQLRAERTSHKRHRRTVRSACFEEDVIERDTQTPPIKICIVVHDMGVSQTSVLQHTYDQQHKPKENNLSFVEHK
jgi:hypothetical protein